jgi:cytochrome P450
MKSKPGFIATQLHRGVAGSSVFLNTAVAQSVEAFRNAFGDSIPSPRCRSRLGGGVGQGRSARGEWASMTTTRPTFEHFLAWLEDSRRLGQVHFDDKSQCWHVLGHPETSAVLSTPAVFSSDLTALQPEQDDLALFQRGNFVRMDPPQHRKLRTLVSQAFTPKVVAGLEPRIAELTTRLLDRADERFDLIDVLAYPLPVIVIAELLGIPTSDQGLFRRWADVLLGQEIDPDQAVAEASGQAVAAVAPTMREMNAYFLDHIRSRRTHPGRDLTSRLVAAEVDGERLADEEIVGFVGVLLIAGHITTTATLGNSVVC